MKIVLRISLLIFTFHSFYNKQSDLLAQNGSPEIVKSTHVSEVQSLAIKQILESLILIREGGFLMGSTVEQGINCSSDESPIHKVSISTFYLSQIEVTQGWWKAIMKDNPSSFCRSDDFPVEMISYNDAINFIDTLNKLSGLIFRLPTEAEWEFCSRGGEKFCNHMYSGSSDPNEVAWTSNNSSHKTHVVKLKTANELGLHDMSGNVWEWVSDWYGKYTAVSQSDPRGPSTGTEKVIRGGSWAGSSDFCRSSIRYHYPPEYKNSYIGFRLAIDQSELK